MTDDHDPQPAFNEFPRDPEMANEECRERLSLSERLELTDLIHKFGCSDITPEQIARMHELEAKLALT